MYNLTNLSNATGFEDLFFSLNQMSGDLLATSIVIVLYMILFVGMLRWGVKYAFAGASLISALIVSLLFAFNLLPFLVLFITWILAGAGVILLFADKN